MPYVVEGYRLWDKVLYKGQECFVSGRRASGSFALRKLDGTVVTNSISFKKLQLLEPATNYLIERISFKKLRLLEPATNYLIERK